jgi:hypothetical protein
MTKPSDLPTISDLDLSTVIGGVGVSAAMTAAKRQRDFAKKIMRQPFPSTGEPGLGF